MVQYSPMGKHSFEYLLIGILILVLGASLNFLVVASNGMQMPTSLEYTDDCFTLVDSEGNELEVTEDTPFALPAGRFFMNETTRLKILGDIIYIENFVFDGYYSAGDVLIEFGAVSIILWLFAAFFTTVKNIFRGGNHFRDKHAFI